MNSIIMSKELEVAKKAVKDAGKIVMKYFGKAKIKVKPDRTIVTQADTEAEKLMRKIITKNFPDHSIIGEEFGKKKTKSQYMWFIDPLDGTTNFSIGNPFFAVSIALVKNKIPIVGATYYPLRDELFYAERGKGAFLNGKRIRVSNKTHVGTSFLAYCHSNDLKSTKVMTKIYSKLKLHTDKVRQIGAATLELCFVACGRIESFMDIGIFPWDVLAGVLLVREAGGKVTTIGGKSFTIDSKSILASNGKIHGKLLKLVKNR